MLSEINNDGVHFKQKNAKHHLPNNKSPDDEYMDKDGVFESRTNWKPKADQFTLRFLSFFKKPPRPTSFIFSLNVNNNSNAPKTLSLYKHIHTHSDLMIVNKTTTKSTTTTTNTPEYYMLMSTATTTTTFYSSSLNDLNYKNNELYSIFVSMFTAAIFIFFIMWRWIRMKSDLRKALREQFEIQQQEQQMNNSSSSSRPPRPSITTPSSVSSLSPIRLSPPIYQQNHFVYTNHRETLTALINQLNDGEPRSNRQNQQIIDTAKYCLQQLRNHSRQQQMSRMDRESFSTTMTTLTNHDRTPPPTTTTATTINESISNSSSMFLNNLETIQEQPPSYESVMTKSSSLPSYCHLEQK